MEESKITPPHAELRITVHKDMQVAENGDLENCRIDISGCPGCLADALADTIIRHPSFRLIFNQAGLIAISRMAKKDN
jgi:hypothetical protein